MRWRGACCHYAAAAAAAAAAIRCCCLCSRCWRQAVLDFVLLSVAASVRSPFALNQKSSKNATPFVLAAVSAPAESPTPNKYRIRAEIIAATLCQPVSQVDSLDPVHTASARSVRARSKTGRPPTTNLELITHA
jgi:BarA-like signal transduction histidine kinase